MPDDAMFIPLAVGEVGAGIGSRPKASKSKRIPIIPVPADAPPQRFRHPRHGFPSREYAYHLATGELAGYALRFDFQRDDGTPDKEVLPVTYCDLDEGKRGWCANGIPAPRPLYGLPELLASQGAPVIVTEGEKKADVVPTLFPGYLGTTSMGGARAAKKSDWAPLAGRNVVIWPDHDASGRSYAEDVAALVTATGAASVSIVAAPENWPERWDLADPLPDGVQIEVLDRLLASATRWTLSATETAPAYVSFGAYSMSAKGLFFESDDPEKPSLWLSAAFEVLALTRDAQGYAWGKLLRWRDLDDRVHEWAMPVKALGGGREEVWRELLDGGLQIAASTASRNRLAE